MPIGEMELDSIECLNPQMLTRTIILLLLSSTMLSAQLPNTNIYMLTLTKGGGKYNIKAPVFMTVFNKTGYNNQPSFISDDEIVFTTNYYSADQTEISKFDLYEETLTRLTYTDESEYSPQKSGKDGAISCVRVEMDGKTQTLSIYPGDGIGYAKRVLHNTNNIGYYEWMDNNEVALFLVEAPDHNLAIANSKSERRKIILDKIGRSLHKSLNGELYFLHKETESDWIIKSYNLLTNKSRIITKSLQGVEDFELLNDGSILMGKGSKLYRYDPKSASKEWQLISDLSGYGIKNITRMAARKNRLVIVDTE